MHLIGGKYRYVLNAQIERHLDDGHFVHFRRNVRHQRQIFDQTARLTWKEFSVSAVATSQKFQHLTSPSGVSDGHNMPHCEGCNERGPETFLVFSNCEFTRVIIPSAEMYDNRDSTCVTPNRSILNLRIVQLPCDDTFELRFKYLRHFRSPSHTVWIALTSEFVIISCFMYFTTSNGQVFTLGSIFAAVFFNWKISSTSSLQIFKIESTTVDENLTSLLNRLNASSNMSDNKEPANSKRLLP